MCCDLSGAIRWRHNCYSSRVCILFARVSCFVSPGRETGENCFRSFLIVFSKQNITLYSIEWIQRSKKNSYNIMMKLPVTIVRKVVPVFQQFQFSGFVFFITAIAVLQQQYVSHCVKKNHAEGQTFYSSSAFYLHESHNNQPEILLSKFHRNLSNRLEVTRVCF